MTVATLLDQAVCAEISGSDRVLVAGVGDENHRDDGVGPAVVRLLCSRTYRAFHMRTILGPAEDLRNRWGGADLAVMVLAARHQSSRPGMVHMLATELPRGRPALLSRLRGLPHRVVVYTVEGASFRVGVGLSPSVKAAAERLADHVECQISALTMERLSPADQRGEIALPNGGTGRGLTPAAGSQSARRPAGRQAWWFRTAGPAGDPVSWREWTSETGGVA